MTGVPQMSPRWGTRAAQRGDAAGVGLAVLLAVLGLSIAANWWLFSERDRILQEKATVEQLKRDTAAAAGACSSSVERLAQAGRARDVSLARELAKIAPAVRADQAAALEALKARPDDAKDLCGSLYRFFQRQIEAERGSK